MSVKLMQALIALSGTVLTVILAAVVAQVWSGFPPADMTRLLQGPAMPQAADAAQMVWQWGLYGLFVLGGAWPLVFVLTTGALATLMMMRRYAGDEAAAYLERVHALEEIGGDAQKKLGKLEMHWDVLNESLDGMFEGSGEIWLVVNAEGRVRRWNDATMAFARRIVPGVESLEAVKLGELWPAYTDGPLAKAVAEAAHNHVPWHGELQVSSQNLHFLAWVWPLGDDVAVLARDISASYQPEHVFKTSEALVRQLVEDSQRPIAVLDSEWRYLYVSQGWKPFFHINQGAKLVGRRHDEVVRGFPPNLPQLTQQLALGQRVGAEEQKLTINNREEVIKWALRPWRDGENRLAGYIFTLTATTELVRLRAQLKEGHERENALAYSDTLTGLPNRQLFHDRLNMAIATAYRQLSKVALVFIDLDGFKKVNDTLGHDFGDMLLKQVAERLKKVTRDTDTVARLGGDEFTIVLSLRDKADAELVAKKVLAALAEPFDLNGHPAHIGGSLGIGMYPTDGTTAMELIKKADAAMYEAKNAGKNTYRFATKEMVIEG
ncbi:MAG: diguanylate cyclase [Pseudomonadaceae bacterium]|nr:diguanylate cyclase [Pseudomonadaceae bacterium]